MEKLKKKHRVLIDVLIVLEESINNYKYILEENSQNE